MFKFNKLILASAVAAAIAGTSIAAASSQAFTGSHRSTAGVADLDHLRAEPLSARQ